MEYVVTGGVAAVVYGDPRFTRDIDIVLRLDAVDAPRFAAAFDSKRFYVPPLDALRREARRAAEELGFAVHEVVDGVEAVESAVRLRPAAVVLDPERIPRGLNDSKKLDAEAREKLYEKICATAQVSVAFGSIARIDRDNILRASLWALARAVKSLPVRPQLVFVDGNQRIDVACECQTVVSGDALVLSVAAASIVAKVTRDRLMARLGLEFPGYGFERHMGYSVPEHFAALARLGPTIHHRKSFAPVAEKLAALGGSASDEAIAELLPL